MAELDITQEQFLEACDKASANPQHAKIVSQIMAVESFVSFKKLMIKRNTEMNEEALKMMLQKEQEVLRKKAALEEEERKKREDEEARKRKEAEESSKKNPLASIDHQQIKPQ